ncbi:MAG: Efflux transporter, family, subunit [Candidatus Taylorbacteria bacterium]|nr:Efflux transporter, family, subunit [Candidatus Taylorbacteria bacterium]
MKSKISHTLSSPKIIVPVAIVVTVALALFIYPMVGNAPQTNIQVGNDLGVVPNTDGTLSLSFPKSGRVESVTVKNGTKVTKGQIIATLSAPDAKGLINQTKGALTLAQAQYASLDLTYANTKKQQDALVDAAYQTLLKTTPEAVAFDTNTNHLTTAYELPVISGNYSLGQEGTITIKTYASGRGMSFDATGLVKDENAITANPVPLGNSGLSILFPATLTSDLVWTISIPNIRSENYAANKNAYDLAVVNRDKVLSELMQNIQGSGGNGSVAKAQVDAAEGAYESALGAYQNNVITSPIDGTVSFIDSDLMVGQTIAAGKTMINIIPNK